MKTIPAIFIGVIAIGATLPALAGPDWQIIEHGRQVKLERMQREAAAAQASKPPVMGQDADPSMNKKAQHEQMLKDSAAMVKERQQHASVK
jgi:hypothetical protein